MGVDIDLTIDEPVYADGKRNPLSAHSEVTQDQIGRLMPSPLLGGEYLHNGCRERRQIIDVQSSSQPFRRHRRGEH